MRKFNVTTAALLLSIAANCVSAATVHDMPRGSHHHHGDRTLVDHFHRVVLPQNAALAEDPSFQDIDAFAKVRGLQTCRTAKTFSTTQISVENTDTVTCVLRMVQAGLTSPALLNLANKTIPGGGVLKGSKAQEEDLCRKTTLYASIKAAQASGEYPLAPFEAIYSPKVWAHDALAVGDSFASISMAGYRMTDGRRDRADHPGDRRQFIAGMHKKIEVILSSAIANGHSNLVLGALGCGAFAKDRTGQPDPQIPVDVADTFDAVLNARYIDGIPFVNHFEHIVFAILEDPRRESLNPTFKRALGILTGNSKTVTLSRARNTPIAHTIMTATAATPAPAYPSSYGHAAAAEFTPAPTFDIRVSNVGTLLKKASGLISIFTGSNVETKLLSKKPWSHSKKPWSTMVKRYEEKTGKDAGQWEIICSFAHNDSIFEVSINGHWKSLNPEARAWLKKVTKK